MTTDPRPDLRALIEALPDFRDRDDSPWPWVSRRAVLALIPPGSVLVTRETLRDAADTVFTAPGVEFGPAKGYYGPYLDDFTDAILAALTPEPTDD
jgi:hypothetical protein